VSSTENFSTGSLRGVEKFKKQSIFKLIMGHMPKTEIIEACVGLFFGMTLVLILCAGYTQSNNSEAVLSIS
jgi:hypothetical protein